MRQLFTLAVTLVAFTPAAALAQTGSVGSGTVEVAGVTALTINNQTISASDEDGDLNLKNATAGAGIHFYLNNKMSIGIAGGFTRLSVGIEDTELSATTVIGGPQVRYRLGSEKTTLVLVGGGGLSRLKIAATGDDIDEVDAEDSQTNGWFWEAGADVSFLVRDNIAFNLGARYQAIKMKDQDDLEFDTAGITVGVGFSFFFGKK